MNFYLTSCSGIGTNYRTPCLTHIYVGGKFLLSPFSLLIGQLKIGTLMGQVVKRAKLFDEVVYNDGFIL